MNQPENNRFCYSYSAKDQAEVKKLREKYLSIGKPSTPDKMEQLRRLDVGVTKKASVIALCFGILGALIMGFGMSLVMTDLHRILGMSQAMALSLGIGIGLAGILAVVAAYPLYQKISEHQRKKAAPEILRLTEELLEHSDE